MGADMGWSKRPRTHPANSKRAAMSGTTLEANWEAEGDTAGGGEGGQAKGCGCTVVYCA